jgi:uncharacterized protein YjbI with pentapeptide repeats
MVYAALDFFLNGLPIPNDTTLPLEGSVLSTYISERQDKSIMNTVDLWAERMLNPFGWRTYEFFHWGLPPQANGQFTRLKSCIDINKSVPLGLFAPGSGGFAAHHQVLGIGYETGQRDQDLKIFVYDPNYPGSECVIQPDITHVRYFETSPGGVHEWLTYFADLNYRPKTPNLNNPCADVPSRDWSGQNQSGRTYNQQDFRCGQFVATNFTGCTMMQTDFSRANAERANFYGANLRNSNLSNAILRKAIFFGADLKTASLVAADATKGNFVGADIQTAALEGGIFDTADFQGANLANTNLQRAQFKNANFYGADLHNAKLDNADFTGAIMTGANLAGVSKHGTKGLP